MTSEFSMFKELDRSYSSKVKVGGGKYLEVEGKGVVAVETPSGTKYIPDVLFVPKLDQNLLSVGQMLEKDYTLLFKNFKYTIIDPADNELMRIKMKNRSFQLEWQ